MIMQQFGSSGKACLVLPSEDLQLDMCLDCWQAHLVGCRGKLAAVREPILLSYLGKAKLAWQSNTPIGAHITLTL